MELFYREIKNGFRVPFTEKNAYEKADFLSLRKQMFPLLVC